VSLEHSSVGVVDGVGKIVREAKVASEPEALVPFFRGLETGVTRMGLEAGFLSQWLQCRFGRGWVRGGAARDAAREGGAVGHGDQDRPSPGSQEVRALLVARKLLQAKLLDVEFSVRGIMPGFGLNMGEVNKGRFAAWCASWRPDMPCWSGSPSRCCGRAKRSGPNTPGCMAICWRLSSRIRCVAD
jgi:transposase